MKLPYVITWQVVKRKLGTGIMPATTRAGSRGSLQRRDDGTKKPIE